MSTKLGEKTETTRGFSLVEFTDSNGEKCSLQASSIAIQDVPGTSAIWLGIDSVKAQVLHGDAEKVGIKTSALTGWVPFPIPEEVMVTTRMHLDREKVEALINHLQAWLDSDTGEF